MSAEPELNTEEADFEMQLATLVVEASRLRQRHAAAEEQPVEKKPLPLPPSPSVQPQNPLQMLKPIMLVLEALSRAVVENTAGISKIENLLSSHASLPPLLDQIQETINRKQSLNQRLFDALCEELRGYKDGFLLDVLHKPVVRDMITLFDDLSNIHLQMVAFLTDLETQPDLTERERSTIDQVKNLGTNVDHVVHSLIEIMERVSVIRMDPSTGKLNKVTQRAVALETAELEEEDGHVARSVKPGFLWRERVLRPELVVVKKWKDNYLVALPQTFK